MSELSLTGLLPLVAGSQPASFTALLDAVGMAPQWELPAGTASSMPEAPEGTTVLALRTADGVVMAGDRRATAGNIIAHRRVQKVYAADDYSAVAISGTAGLAVELIKLFQTELEHYEKLEGMRLSLEGKANHLASMVRNQLPLAFQGLVVIPLFCGYDEREQRGHLYTYDVVGGRYEEQDFATTGSGGMEARSFLKGAYRDDLPTDEAIRIAIEGLVAASEEDTATGGPDIKRGIYPTVVTVSATGFVEIPEDRVAAVSGEVVEARP